MSETLTGCAAASTDSTSRSTKVPVEISSVRPEPGKIALKAPRRTKPPKHIADFDMAGRREFLKELGYQPFRASQLSKHYFERLVNDPAQMTDLPAQDRDEIVSRAMPQLLTPVRTLEADGGDTLKVVHRLFDGALIESVIMRYDNRVTMCISSQAGCGMNCPFCATGQQGLTRNLSTAEIVEQVVAGARYLKQMKGLDKADGGSEDTRPLRVSNIVFMGMGEALANYKSTMGAVHRLIDPAPEGLGISARGLTMSTVGLVPGIRKFELEKLPITLALSLHAPDDELRDELIPINQRWKVDETLDAAYDYYRTTGRRISIEYALIRDINDQGWRADLLGKKLAQRGRGWVHVNPIPLNPTPGSKWTASRKGVEQNFVERLRAHGIPTTIRDTRGSDIDGACGQLAAKEEE
ncbi:23S rRNA (adenine(2503)-C(2))-methyltransferase RlmN [Rothia sp. HMSC058E10]|jgi:23S rRNA m2A2503 methyltransferase|uniref:Probable dual-specificity RNA methyltransferase RlmN n=2 Tax=Rothia dentocariosa TaxID=2047 RepID=A0A2A8D8B5_9MICC|nr:MULTISPECIES: 23S rRNA (adenine(2503)-C(2))-methyltransferase RlmN [Rothia]ADP39737.1 23S rRNA m2A2503 methyltransferase [Rothia dentocariosa ATCC 17931]EFJ77782.1 23S rRNA m2A2503 methyltransferase [Rothia dentocariosa M567]MCM3437631.1 23S rRNA (adenine(2503)-C(2))-methyltransferase RlmN [Rothia dentocariosa]OFN14615.1 23S rRNA (adenine(2503)-C(2))-methyltransferase RlmN [Rothia sp. HMSC058E10]OFN45300.1 23S rRNA (adenine(2503)-C(2))-methyltransferase RlmN [Rothia sp. HMSC071F11]